MINNQQFTCIDQNANILLQNLGNIVLKWSHPVAMEEKVLVDDHIARLIFSMDGEIVLNRWIIQIAINPGELRVA